MGILETVLIVIIFISVTALIYLAVLSNNSKLEKERFSFLTDRLSIATGIYQVIEDIDVINDTHKLIRGDVHVDSANVVVLRSAQQALFVGMEKLAHPDDLDRVLEFVEFSTLNERLKDTNSITIEYRTGFDSTYRRARFVVAERTFDGRISHVLWMIEDIEEERKKRKEADEFANKVNERLTTLATIYISMHDFDIKNDTLSVIAVNNKDITDIVGKVTSNLQGVLTNTMDQMSSDESRETIKNFVNLGTLDERLAGKDTITCEFLSYRNLWCRARFIVSERDEEGRVSKALYLVESVDEEKRDRDALYDISVRAIAANEAKSAFLSNVSHEIRTPINAVLGMNEMVMRETEDKNILAYSESIHDAGSSLLGIVNDILDFSRIEAGKLDIIPVEYELSSLLNDLKNVMRQKCEKKGLLFITRFNEDIPNMLYGDEIRIKQVITNILSNAVKYTNEGSVTFNVSYENDTDDNILLRVSVSDTGIGIKQEDMEKVFKDFERVEREKNRTVEGMGLGMAITTNILSMMGSSLEVESEYGKGSVFSFYLKQKVVKWDRLGDSLGSYDSDINGSEKDKKEGHFIAPDADILVVDDTKMNLTVFKNLLKQTEVKIDTATSGDAGIEKILKKHYDIIFLDHMMPEKDGIETLNEIKQMSSHPNQDTPVVCITANAIAGSRERYISAGFDDYMSKPLDPEKLEKMVRKHLKEELIKEVSEEAVRERNMESARKQSAEIEKYAAVKGIDISVGIKNCGSIEGYKPILNIFYDQIDKNIKDIERFYENSDWENYSIKVHSLKSSARTVGAMELGAAAESMEHAGKARNADYIRHNHEMLISDYALYKDLLKDVCRKDEDDKDKIPAGRDKAKEMFEELRKASVDMDVLMIDDILKKAQGYSFEPDDNEILQRFKERYDEFDYDGMAEVVSLNGRAQI
ncbi:MAG TPA: hypothetical protein DCG85_06485 [Lachnospiraceae bacterium]|nr:hypothetical protein [Lachnospiraceae bacterium]